MLQWFHRLFGRRATFEADMADELRTHIDMRTRDLMREGFKPEEAQRRARLEFGSVEAYKDRCRSERRFSSVAGTFESIWRDIRFGWRRLQRAPVFTAFAILTLAIGIGATTAIYSVVHATLLRPLDIRNIDEVVNVYRQPLPATALHLMTFSWPEVTEIRASQSVFSDTLAWSFFGQQMSGPNGVEIVRGEMVSSNYFSFVGAMPLHGRALQPADDDPASPDVVVISEALWHRQFGGEMDAIGRTLTLRGRQYEVVGMMPASFRGVDVPNVVPTNIWAPLRSAAHLRGPMRLVDGSAQDVWTKDNWVFLKGRLLPGKTLADARVEMAAIGARLAASMPNESVRAERQLEHGFHATMASDVHAHESVDAFAVPIATAVLAAMGLALLVACTNLANFMLARGERRRSDVAIARALGASRARTLRELAAESAIVAVAGCAVGLLFSAWLMHLLSGSLAIGGLTMSLQPRFEPAVAAVSIGATVGAMLVFGLIPAWRSSRVDTRSFINAGTGGALPRWRGRRVLIALQVAISVMLLVISAQFVRALVTSAWRDRGIDFGNLVASEVQFRFHSYETARLEVMLDHALASLSRIPGIESIAVVGAIPLHLGDQGAWATVDTQPRDPTLMHQRDFALLSAEDLPGTSGLFDTLGIAIRQGRTFTAAEVAGKAPVCLVSDTLSARLFGGDPALGRTIFRGQEPCTVIGVAGDVEERRAERGRIYRPWAFDPQRQRSLVIAARTTRDAALVLDPMREVLRSIDPNFPMIEVVTGEDLLSRSTMFTRVSAHVTMLIGVFTLVLALVGLSGLLAYVVANRRREIGLRMALGADPPRIRRMVIRDGIWPAMIGMAIGVAAGGLLGRIRPLQIATRAAGQPAFDWLAVAGVVVVLLVTTFLACYLPARAAARVDPNVALKEM